MHVHRSVVTALLVASPAILLAQAEPASIPSVLATALIAGNRGTTISRDPRFVVGSVPSGWPEGISPPAPATIVGGMISGDMLVGVFADSTKQFLENYFAWLSAAGFRSAATQSAPIASTGFQGTAYMLYGHFCRDSSGLTATNIPVTSTYALVHVSYSRVDAGCMFRPGVPSRTSVAPTPGPLTFPPLRPPASSRFPLFGGSSSSGGDVSTRVRLADSTLGSAAIVEHYAKQLVAGGWVAGEAQGAYSDTFASQRFTANDRSGRRWTGTLSVVSTGVNRDVSITMWLEAKQ